MDGNRERGRSVGRIKPGSRSSTFLKVLFGGRSGMDWCGLWFEGVGEKLNFLGSGESLGCGYVVDGVMGMAGYYFKGL